MSMTQTTKTNEISEGDRIYATEDIDYLGVAIPAGHEGTVADVTDNDGAELGIEWDFGLYGMANSGSVALIESLGSPGNPLRKV